MNPSAKPGEPTVPWPFIIGMLLGAALLAFMAWSSLGRPGGSGSAHVVELTQENWQKEVVESRVPVLVDFWAEWCGPCKAFAPTIDKIAAKYKGKVKVGKLDMGDKSFNKARKLADQYGINGIPHVLIFNGGERPRFQFVGRTSETELANAIDKLLQ